ncbi:MAG: LON peptidase substrate-binding domain-containing protein [Paracoccaceae bacterium]
MMNAADLPDQLPVFPLPGAVLLPRARLPLHIFEPRYLAMIEDCLKSERRLIGMIQPRGDAGGLASVGCAGRITSFSETDDGRYMITLSGIARFMVRTEITGFVPYRRVNVDWTPFIDDIGPSEEDVGFDREAFLPRLARYLHASRMGTDWSNLKEADNEMLINAMCMVCPFAVEEKQALLEAQTLTDRRQVLEQLITFALQSGGGDEVLQ